MNRIFPFRSVTTNVRSWPRLVSPRHNLRRSRRRLVLDDHRSVPIRLLAFSDRDAVAGDVLRIRGVPIEFHPLLQCTYD
jgi:hypothetical protein